MAFGEHHTVVGIFETPQNAQQAVMELKAMGFTQDEIGVLSRNKSGDVVGKNTAGDPSNVAEGAAAGAAAGAGIGALWGLGVLAGVIPGIGPAIVGGTLGILLSSAAAGAAAAGIAGALMGAGVPEDEAAFFEEEFKRGRTLITVRAGKRAEASQQLIQRHGGHIREPKTSGV